MASNKTYLIYVPHSDKYNTTTVKSIVSKKYREHDKFVPYDNRELEKITNNLRTLNPLYSLNLPLIKLLLFKEVKGGVFFVRSDLDSITEVFNELIIEHLDVEFRYSELDVEYFDESSLKFKEYLKALRFEMMTSCNQMHQIITKIDYFDIKSTSDYIARFGSFGQPIGRVSNYIELKKQELYYDNRGR